LVITEAEVRDAENGKLLAKMLGTMVPSVIA
jgi:acyl-coenzyme A thioesterase PaaI-like protein